MTEDETVRVSIEIAADPRTTFDVFTQDVDAWWGRGPRFRFVPPYRGTLEFEPFKGGRFLHRHDRDPSKDFVIGTISAWAPGERLTFEWRQRTFRPDQTTHVEIVFEPSPLGTRVTLTHSGWDQIEQTNVVRHGLTGRAFVMKHGENWADLLRTYKVFSETKYMAKGEQQ